MDVLRATISYSQIIDWGGARFASERRIREWMAGREELTLGEALARPVEPWILLWVVLHERFITDRGMHEAALELGRALLDELAKKGAYLDFRCERLLQAKRRWLDGELSLGELRVAQAKGERMCEELAELGSAESSAAAFASWHATNDDGAGALRSIFGILDSLDNREDGRRARLNVITRHLRKEA